jgi:flagellar basal-body rod protein FlgB
MSDISFGSTVGMLKNAMDGSSETHSVIANNIANVNTPNFHRSDVSFKEALARTEATDGDPNELAMVTNDARQIAIGGHQYAQPFAIATTVDDEQQMRVDGSNVDIDQEMAKLSLNSSYGQTMAQMLQNQYSRFHKIMMDQA